MIPKRIGLASRSRTVSLADLTRVTAAINLQVQRDFQPIWNINASIVALPDPESIEPGIWPVFIVDDVGFGGALGLHLTDNQQPYALVQAGGGRCGRASADPGPCPQQGNRGGFQHRGGEQPELVVGGHRRQPRRRADYLQQRSREVFRGHLPARLGQHGRGKSPALMEGRAVDGIGHDRVASTTPESVNTSATICAGPSGSRNATAEATTPITGTAMVPIAATDAGSRASAANQLT